MQRKACKITYFEVSPHVKQMIVYIGYDTNLVYQRPYKHRILQIAKDNGEETIIIILMALSYERVYLRKKKSPFSAIQSNEINLLKQNEDS